MPLLALELLLQLTLVAVVCGFQTDLCGPSGAACNCRTGHGTVSLGTVDALISRKLGNSFVNGNVTVFVSLCKPLVCGAVNNSLVCVNVGGESKSYGDQGSAVYSLLSAEKDRTSIEVTMLGPRAAARIHINCGMNQSQPILISSTDYRPGSLNFTINTSVSCYVKSPIFISPNSTSVVVITSSEIFSSSMKLTISSSGTLLPTNTPVLSPSNSPATTPTNTQTPSFTTTNPTSSTTSPINPPASTSSPMSSTMLMSASTTSPTVRSSSMMSASTTSPTVRSSSMMSASTTSPTVRSSSMMSASTNSHMSSESMMSASAMSSKSMMSASANSKSMMSASTNSSMSSNSMMSASANSSMSSKSIMSSFRPSPSQAAQANNDCQNCNDECRRKLAIALGTSIPATALLTILAMIPICWFCQKTIKKKGTYIRMAPTVYFDEDND